MKPINKSIIFLVIGCFLAPVENILAHDPGLSRSSARLQDTGLAIHMVFARRDLELLAPIDTDYDGRVTTEEFSMVRPRLQTLFTNSVNVQQAGEIVLPKSVRVDPAPKDTVDVELQYDYPRTSAVRLQIPLIGQLPRGHRQYLAVQDSKGNLLTQHILEAASPQVLLAMSEPSELRVFREYLLEGIWHIWVGFDHVLFLLTLLLPAVLVYRNCRWRSLDRVRPATIDIFKVVTAFTIAHSITLALAVLNIVVFSPRLVESVIAFSVLITAINNLRPIFPTSRWLLAFAFGLVHGFGFASVLMDLGLPDNALIISLLGFNLGVEAGQLAIVAIVFPVAAILRHTTFYRTWLFSGGSAAAAMIATVWIFERIFDYEVLALR